MNIHIVLQEQTEGKGLAYLHAITAFRYPTSQDGRLYIVCKDSSNNPFVLIAEESIDDDATVRLVEDPVLFETIMTYYQQNSSVPLSSKDQAFWQRLTSNADKPTVKKLETTL
jgi:hypothetical protein